MFHLGGNEKGVFNVGITSGVITVAQTLDREDQSVYYLDIQASNGEPDYTVVRYRRRRAVDASIITVKISVGDINDKAPVFLQDEYFGCKLLHDRFFFQSFWLTGWYLEHLQIPVVLQIV